MAIDTVKFSGWVAGRDARHAADPTHSAYQYSEEAPARLLYASNVDIHDDGRVTRRAGLTEIDTVTDGKALHGSPWENVCLFQDEGAIKTLDVSDDSVASLVTGLSDSLTIQFHDLAGKVFYTNGTEHGLITAADTATNWGMTVPPTPTLGTTAGDLPAGRYRVACALIDGNGAISGAPASAAQTLNGSQDLTVDLSATDSNATHARVYCSYMDSAELYYVGQVAVGALPATITNVNVSNEKLETQFLSGPQAISSIAGIGSWAGFMLFWKDDRVAHSMGNAHHLFDLRKAVWKLPHTVKAVAGLTEGPCWVATEKGMFRYSGMPGGDGFSRKPMDTRAYAAGSVVIDAGKVPALADVSGRVALFACEDGLAVGTDDGRLLHPIQAADKWTVADKTASFIYRESGSLNQILCALE